MNSTTTAAPRVCNIGPDRITVTDQEVIIEAKRAMPDWEVREFQVVPIYFEERKYRLIQKNHADGPYSWRYLLHPWPEEYTDCAKTFHTYDAETVGRRDGTHKKESRAEVVYVCLLPLYPFLGFSWSGVQHWLNRFGFVPRTLTSVSILTAFSLAFAELVFFGIALNGGMRSGELMIGGMFRLLTGCETLPLGFTSISTGSLDVALFLIFVTDSAMRFTYYFREDQWTGGLLEWLLPSRRASF